MMASTRVRRRRQPRVPPHKRRQPLPQFGGRLFGNTWIDRAARRGGEGLFRLAAWTARQGQKRRRRKGQKGGRINAYIKRRTSM